MVFPRSSTPRRLNAPSRYVAKIRWAAIATSALLLAGCASLGYKDAGDALSAFEALADNPQIRYAPAAERYARQLVPLLPEATRHVASMHGRDFRSLPLIYVCDSDACFHRFVAAQWNYTAAVVYDNRLLLAPRLFAGDSARLRPILLHELSHLHMGQYRGHYTMDIPVWFHEGLASLVADGGGADLVSDDDAWRAALAGRHFRADEQHLPWQRTRADVWDISISVFYRQSMLFLDHLRRRDATTFARLLEFLRNGEGFDAAFARTYQANPNRLAQAFFRCLDQHAVAQLDPCRSDVKSRPAFP